MRYIKSNLLLLSVIFLNLHSLCAQTADDIINKCLDASGGKEKISSIQSVYKEGTSDAGGAEIKVKYWAINKTSSRFESEFGGMKTYSIVRNDSGWFYNPRRGQKQAEPMTADAVKHAQFGLDIQSPLLNYKEKGYSVRYLGVDDELDGSDAYKLELTVNPNLSITYYIDPDSYFIFCTRTKESVNGRTSVSKAFYSNYKKTTDGYVFPMEVGRTKYSLIKVNTDIDKTLFYPPNR